MEVEQTGIITKHFKKHKLAILNDVFAAVAVLDLKVPNIADQSIELRSQIRRTRRCSLFFRFVRNFP